MAVEIPLTRGKVALVDEPDFPLVAGLKWSAVFSCGHWYAARNRSRGVKPRTELMHRRILDARPSEIIDHRDGDGLNNCRLNLRRATKLQNQTNSKLRRDNSSGFKGVHSHKGRWRAKIQVIGITIHLGVFQTAEEAALAYDAAARIHFGEFGSLNFPQLADVGRAANQAWEVLSA